MLTFSEKSKLADALLCCPTIAEHSSRMIVISELQVSIEYNPTDKYHVFNLVKACEQHSGGIKELIEVVQYFEGASNAFQNLERIVDVIVWPSAIISKLQCEELVDILSSITVPSERLLKLYRESLPFGLPIDSQADTLRSILRHLAKLPRQKGGVFPYPILEFALRLAFAIDHQESREQIEAWVEARAKELEVSTSEMTSLRERVTPRPKHSDPEKKLYLLIELEPDVVDKHREISDQARYVVNTWLLHGDNKREVKLPEDFYTLTDMTNVLDELLYNLIFEERHATNDNLMIEFLLPANLLCSYPVEHEPLPRHTQKLPIGCRYQVVVRPRERVRYNVEWEPPRWKRHWKKIEDPLQLVSQKAIVWSGKLEDQSFLELCIQMEEQPILVCVPISSVRSSNIDHHAPIILEMIRDAGTPIALWTRQIHSDGQQIRKDFEALLTVDQVEGLCELVRRERRKAWIKKRHEPYVTLLWDDPTRIPPPARQLSAPVREG